MCVDACMHMLFLLLLGGGGGGGLNLFLAPLNQSSGKAG